MLSGLSLTKEESWLEIWRNVLKHSPQKTRVINNEKELVERWNKRAKNFTNNSNTKDKSLVRATVIDKLKESGILRKGIHVLDIGAGIGNYSLPISKIADTVVALEPASEMVNILRNRINGDKIKNIKVMDKRWQEINLQKEQMVKQFDLVFASMTPGIQEPKDILKMNDASREACYLSTQSGQRWQFAEELWNYFFDEPMGDNPRDIIYPFGLIYSMGYQPEMFSLPMRASFRQSKEIIAEKLIWYFSNYLDITLEKEKIIKQYVENNLHKLKESSNNRHASSAMIWWVHKPEVK